jgi:hypothetical protein
MQLRKNRTYRKQVYKTGRLVGVGPTTVKYLILLLLASLSLLYLVQSAQGADKAIELRNLEDQKAKLDTDLTSLEVNASRWQSLQNLSQSATTQGLVSIGDSASALQPASPKP